MLENTIDKLNKMAKQYERLSRISMLESVSRDRPFECDICGCKSNSVRCYGCFSLMAEALAHYASKIEEHCA